MKFPCQQSHASVDIHVTNGRHGHSDGTCSLHLFNLHSKGPAKVTGISEASLLLQLIDLGTFFLPRCGKDLRYHGFFRLFLTGLILRELVGQEELNAVEALNSGVVGMIIIGLCFLSSSYTDTTTDSDGYTGLIEVLIFS